MQYVVHRALEVDVVGDVVLDEREVAVVQVRDVADVTRQQVVDPDDRIPAIEKSFGEVRADEARRAGDDHSLFHGSLPAALNPELKLSTRASGRAP